MRTKDLKNAIDLVIGATESTNVIMDEISHVIFTGDSVSAYNGKIAISTTLSSGIHCSVPASILKKTIAAVESDEVSMELENGVVYITSEDVKATIAAQTEDLMALEAIQEFEYVALYDGDGEPVPSNFVKSLELCNSSVSDKVDDMHSSNCVYISGDLMVGSDGYKVTFADLECEMQDMLLPASATRELVKINPEAYLVEDSGWVHFIDRDTDAIISCRKAVGTYPDLVSLREQFRKEVHLQLPEKLGSVAKELGSLSDSSLDAFKIVQISILDESITCTVSNDTASVSKTIDFLGNESCAEFFISSVMFSKIMERTTNLMLNEKFAVFVGEDFEHFIILPEQE